MPATTEAVRDGGPGGRPRSWAAVLARTLYVLVLLSSPPSRCSTAWHATPADLDTLTAELLAAAEQTVQPTRASLWLRNRPGPGGG